MAKRLKAKQQDADINILSGYYGDQPTAVKIISADDTNNLVTVIYFLPGFMSETHTISPEKVAAFSTVVPILYYGLAVKRIPGIPANPLQQPGSALQSLKMAI